MKRRFFGKLGKLTSISHSAARLWKSMHEFQPTEQVLSIEFSETAAFPNQVVTFPPFTVICGSHGSGKSSLLGYVAECLYRGSRHPDDPPFFERDVFNQNRPALEGSCEVGLRRNEQFVNYAVDLGKYDKNKRTPREVLESGGVIYPHLLSPHTIASEINMFFQDFKMEHLAECIAGDNWVHNRKDLDALRDILGVAYDEVLYIPVETDKYAPVWPYVKARRGADWIDSYSMSYGELCVHFLRWTLKDSENEVVLLDEPEANIAPRGQPALLDELARLARTVRTQVILATHSVAFLNRVPLEWVRMCVRPTLEPVVIAPSQASDLRDTLGIDNPLRSILVVEDGVAEYVLKLILSAHKFTAMSECDIITAGSWQDVLTTAKALSSSRRLRSVAVLDGDQRGQHSSGSTVLYLPGDEPPEKVFLKYAATQPAQLAERLSCSVASITVYLAEMLGLEHHRWLTILARRTGQERNYCLRVVFDIWREDPDHKAQCETLARRVEDLISPSASGHGTT